jgi:hypothetical protein
MARIWQLVLLKARVQFLQDGVQHAERGLHAKITAADSSFFGRLQQFDHESLPFENAKVDLEHKKHRHGDGTTIIASTRWHKE